MKIMLKVPRWKLASFLLRARKYRPASTDTKLSFHSEARGFAHFDVSTTSVVDAVRIILMLPKGSLYAETEPLTGWQMDALMA